MLRCFLSGLSQLVKVEQEVKESKDDALKNSAIGNIHFVLEN